MVAAIAGKPGYKRGESGLLAERPVLAAGVQSGNTGRWCADHRRILAVDLHGAFDPGPFSDRLHGDESSFRGTHELDKNVLLASAGSQTKRATTLLAYGLDLARNAHVLPLELVGICQELAQAGRVTLRQFRGLAKVGILSRRFLARRYSGGCVGLARFLTSARLVALLALALLLAVACLLASAGLIALLALARFLALALGFPGLLTLTVTFARAWALLGDGLASANALLGCTSRPQEQTEGKKTDHYERTSHHRAPKPDISHFWIRWAQSRRYVAPLSIARFPSQHVARCDRRDPPWNRRTDSSTTIGRTGRGLYTNP